MTITTEQNAPSQAATARLKNTKAFLTQTKAMLADGEWHRFSATELCSNYKVSPICFEELLNTHCIERRSARVNRGRIFEYRRKNGNLEKMSADLLYDLVRNHVAKRNNEYRANLKAIAAIQAAPVLVEPEPTQTKAIVTPHLQTEDEPVKANYMLLKNGCLFKEGIAEADATGIMQANSVMGDTWTVVQVISQVTATLTFA